MWAGVLPQARTESQDRNEMRSDDFKAGERGSVGRGKELVQAAMRMRSCSR